MKTKATRYFAYLEYQEGVPGNQLDQIGIGKLKEYKGMVRAL
jgi:hypothetical protein